MRTSLATAALFLVFLAAPAHAVTGEQLLEGLRHYYSPPPNQQHPNALAFSSGMSLGFISGVVHSAAGIQELCYGGKEISMAQMGAIVQKYLENNPASWNEDAAPLVVSALQEAFPCKQPGAS